MAERRGHRVAAFLAPHAGWPADPAWYDTQYNNRARVPTFPAILRRWQADSARARSGLRCALDLPYGPEAGERLDVFAPVRPGAPVLVFIHGGYWRALDKADHSFVAPALVEAGAMVVVPNYDLCPKVSVPAIVMQMVRALAWTYRHARAHGGDPARIVVAGHSAGGHLAAMLANCRWAQAGADLPTKLLRSALSISGLFDLEPLRRSPMLQADLRLTPQAVRQASPARLPAPAGVPLDAVVGALESEEFVRQNGLLRRAWGEAAVPVCETVPGRHHFDILDDLLDPQARLHRLARGLLGLG